VYKKIEPPLRMTSIEAVERYPDSYILFQSDGWNPPDDMGNVLYIGDDHSELFRLALSIDAPYSGIEEGRNHRRIPSLGGVVVGN